MEIKTIDQFNLEEHPGAICFINRKNQAHHLKMEWIKQRLVEGLRIKLIYDNDNKKLIGFIEYIPGEYAWRAVSAKGYMFIHCVWIYPNINKNRGFGSRLIQECIADAKHNKCKGVAVVASKNSFMANNNLFLKNGFQLISNDGKRNELLVISFAEGQLPTINNWENQLSKFKGLHIVYTKQCPWVARMVTEISGWKLLKNLDLHVKELKTAYDAQNAPSLYSSFNLIYNGKLLADRYISTTRFRNILINEKLIKTNYSTIKHKN